MNKPPLRLIVNPSKVSWWTIPQTREEFAMAWRERDRERLTKLNQVQATQAVKTFGIRMCKHRKGPPDDAA